MTLAEAGAERLKSDETPPTTIRRKTVNKLWLVRLRTYLDGKPWCQIDPVMEYLIGEHRERWGDRDVKQAVHCLHLLGWTNQRDSAPGPDGKRAKRYRPATKAAELLMMEPEPEESEPSDSESDLSSKAHEATWITPAKAARSTRLVQQGSQYLAIGTNATKAILSVKAKASEGLAEVAVVEAVVAGVSLSEIIAKLRCTPRVAMRALKDYRAAQALVRGLARDELKEAEEQRQEAERQRSHEIETGHPDVPTTWAWCDFLFRDPVSFTYLDAKKKLDAWLANGGALEAVSPFVKRALESREAWFVARRLWEREVHREADRRARETRTEEHKMRMLDAKADAVERTRAEAAQRRTAALVNAAKGGRPRARVAKQSTESMDERTDKGYDEHSTEEEGST